MKLARTQDSLIASENDTILLSLHGKGTIGIGPINSTFGREERERQVKTNMLDILALGLQEYMHQKQSYHQNNVVG